MYQSTFWLPRLEEKLLSQPITRATKEHKKHLGTKRTSDQINLLVRVTCKFISTPKKKYKLGNIFARRMCLQQR